MTHEEKQLFWPLLYFYHTWAVIDNFTSLWETNAEVKCYNEHKLNYLQPERSLWLPVCDLLVLHCLLKDFWCFHPGWAWHLRLHLMKIAEGLDL